MWKQIVDKLKEIFQKCGTFLVCEENNVATYLILMNIWKIRKKNNF